MKQAQYSPLSVAEMAVSLYAAEKGHLKDVELAKVGDFESALIDYMNNQQKALMDKINETCNFDDDIAAELEKALTEFKSTQTW